MYRLAQASQWRISALANHLVKPFSSRFLSTQPLVPPNVTVVNNRESAMRVMDILMAPEMAKKYHACDTEVMNIDVKNQSPVGHGEVICASVYCGPDVDFGSGPRLWIDNLDEANGTLDFFKPYFEDARFHKVWHNYSFDFHVLGNHDIRVQGFGGDTMHMARLWNAARTLDGGYSLEALSEELLGTGKISMKDRFSKAKLKKDGTEGKTRELPPVEEIQRDPETRSEWIEYSTYDAEATWHLREALEAKLRTMPWDDSGHKTMFDFYTKYYRPFGQCLVDMERNGIYVRAKDYLPEVEKKAEIDRELNIIKFREWAIRQRPEAKYMNISSASQKQQFFFAPFRYEENGKVLCDMPAEREFKTDNVEGIIEEGKTKPKKSITFTLRGLGMPTKDLTAKKLPAVSLEVLRGLAGKVGGEKPKYGAAYDFFGGGEAGKEACEAIDALCKVSAVNMMLNTFIKPLQEDIDVNSRVHCSLNLNTETGRLSARRPNLQNQPALEKDIYKIRDAFAAVEGKTFIVADYGQLELRVLAHITKCKSMIEAFKLGGDFHSRTALGMYPHIQKAIENKECLLEWDYAQGPPPVPLLKDMFGSERRKAKVLNFSIAYGKTARGLSSDWDVSLEEAQETLELWYRDRPEVKIWQQRTIEEAHRTEATRTLMGRYRPLPSINHRSASIRNHAERAAINTPIQGGAADIVMKAMLDLHANQRLKDLGWMLLLQIHDEVILEGPKESAEEALALVKHIMENPFKKPLLVDMVVDAKSDVTWYLAK